MKLKPLLLSMVASAAFVAAAPSAQAFPAIGADSGPGLILTLNPGNTVTITATGQGPYDSIEDTYVGVVNNSGHSVSLIHLSAASTDIFGFDGDGIDGSSYLNIPFNAQDGSGYGGPNAYFTNIGLGGCGLMCGDVNFITPIADGGTDFFSLEESLDAATFTGGGVTLGGVPEPSTWAMLLIGFLGLGFLVRRQARSALA